MRRDGRDARPLALQRVEALDQGLSGDVAERANPTAGDAPRVEAPLKFAPHEHGNGSSSTRSGICQRPAMSTLRPKTPCGASSAAEGVQLRVRTVSRGACRAARRSGTPRSRKNIPGQTNARRATCARGTPMRPFARSAPRRGPALSTHERGVATLAVPPLRFAAPHFFAQRSGFFYLRARKVFYVNQRVSMAC